MDFVVQGHRWLYLQLVILHNCGGRKLAVKNVNLLEAVVASFLKFK
jgi:hypothetical protein